MRTSNISITHSSFRFSPLVFFERFGPAMLGALAFFVCARYGKLFFVLAAHNKWHVDNVYISAFSIASGSAAFLFAFLTYVRTLETNAMRILKKSIHFKRACRYIVSTILFLLIFSVVTVPLTVMVPEPKAKDLVFWILSLWFSSSVYAGAAAARSFYHFMSILDAADGERFKS